MKNVTFLVALLVFTSGSVFAQSTNTNTTKKQSKGCDVFTMNGSSIVVADITTQASPKYDSTNTNDMTNQKGKKGKKMSFVAMDITTQASPKYDSTNTNDMTNQKGKKGKKMSFVAMDITTQASPKYDSTNTNDMTNQKGKKGKKMSFFAQATTNTNKMMKDKKAKGCDVLIG